RAFYSPIRRIRRDIPRQLPLPPRAVRKQPLLVIEELLARLRRIFEIRSLDDRVDRTSFLTHAAVDALRHVDVVASRSPRPVIPAGARLDRDRLRRADRFTEFAGDAALFAVGVAAQGVLAPEARRKRRLFVGIVQRRLWFEHVADRQAERLKKLA